MACIWHAQHFEVRQPMLDVKGSMLFLNTNFLAYILSLIQAIPLERWGVGMGVYMYDYVSVHRN